MRYSRVPTNSKGVSGTNSTPPPHGDTRAVCRFQVELETKLSQSLNIGSTSRCLSLSSTFRLKLHLNTGPWFGDVQVTLYNCCCPQPPSGSQTLVPFYKEEGDSDQYFINSRHFFIDHHQHDYYEPPPCRHFVLVLLGYCLPRGVAHSEESG